MDVKIVHPGALDSGVAGLKVDCSDRSSASQPPRDVRP